MPVLRVAGNSTRRWLQEQEGTPVVRDEDQPAPTPQEDEVALVTKGDGEFLLSANTYARGCQAGRNTS